MSDLITVAFGTAERFAVESICDAVTITAPHVHCDYESIFLPDNVWLQAVIGMFVLKIFVHICWLFEIACADKKKRGYMTAGWVISACISIVWTCFTPGPNTPQGFFKALEQTYVPFAFKIAEYQNVLF
jgi:hypothetical protein